MRYSKEAKAHKAFAEGCGGHAPEFTTNPPVSKAQARFMRGVAAGRIKAKGLSKPEADEYVSGFPTKDLPERARKR